MREVKLFDRSKRNKLPMIKLLVIKKLMENYIVKNCNFKTWTRFTA